MSTDNTTVIDGLERSATQPDDGALKQAMMEQFLQSMKSMSRRDRRKVERDIKKQSIIQSLRKGN